MNTKLIGIGALVAFLSACQAEDVQVKLDTSDIMDVAKGQTVYVDFSARVGEDYTTIDDKKRNTIKQVTDLMEKFFPDADIYADIQSDKYSIELDGKLSVSSKPSGAKAPWYLDVERNDIVDGYLVSLKPSASFDSFKDAMKDIDFMLGPDEFQPIKYRFSGDSGMIIFGGGYLDGRPVTAGAVPLKGDRLNLVFEKGVWTTTGGGFLYVP